MLRDEQKLQMSLGAGGEGGERRDGPPKEKNRPREKACKPPINKLNFKSKQNKKKTPCVLGIEYGHFEVGRQCSHLKRESD